MLPNLSYWKCLQQGHLVFKKQFGWSGSDDRWIKKKKGKLFSEKIENLIFNWVVSRPELSDARFVVQDSQL